MDKLRGSVRPILTITGWLVLLYLAITSNGDIRNFFLGSVSTMIGFWFGQRKAS